MTFQITPRAVFQNVYRNALLGALFGLLILQHAAHAQTLKADYQFQGNLASSVAGAPNMTNVGGQNVFQTDVVDGYSRNTLRFPANNGLSVNTTGLIPTNSYTVVILFKFDNVTGTRRRVFDAKQALSDTCGAYINASRLDIETTAATPIYPSTYVQVVITRQTNSNIRIQRDGYTFVSSNDNGCYSNDGNNLRFFVDDNVVGNETSAGNVARIRLYDGPLTQAQVWALDRPANATGTGDQAILFETTRHNFPEIYSMNSDGTNERRLTNDSTIEFNARWSPNKSKIVFTRQATASSLEQIWIMNADGSGQTPLSNSAFNDHAPSFKPDGTKIAFSRCDVNFVCDIYTMNPDGTGQQPFSGAANPSYDEDIPNYAPNGTKIVFSRTALNAGDTTSGLYSLTEAGAVLQRLTAPVLPIGDREARYSPDGTKIAFARFPSIFTAANTQASEIYTINADGTGETRITNNAVHDSNPLWSPNGLQFAFHSQRDVGVNELYTMNSATGANVLRLTSNSAADFANDWYPARRTPFDFDGDGKTDISIFRPSVAQWWYLKSSGGGSSAVQFGSTSDRVATADFTGDGKCDIAFFRPSTGFWFILRSEDQSFFSFPFGANGDIPLAADFDGDGKADPAVFRPSNSTWYISKSLGGTTIQTFGIANDKPVVADYDGDGRADVAIYRPSTGEWWIQRSSSGVVYAFQFGVSTDNPVPGDFTGDGKADAAFFRPSTGFWYVLRSEDSSFFSFPFGAAGDKPSPGDYDGDGRFDAAVFRPSNSTWYVNATTAGVSITGFGTTGDVSLPNSVVP